MKGFLMVVAVLVVLISLCSVAFGMSIMAQTSMHQLYQVSVTGFGSMCAILGLILMGVASSIKPKVEEK